MKMPARTRDITGKRFGWFVALHYVPHELREGRAKKGAHWLCRCSCGNKVIVSLSNLTTGHSTSCGCRVRFKYSHKAWANGHDLDDVLNEFDDIEARA